jgi:hypothetical protein
VVVCEVKRVIVEEHNQYTLLIGARLDPVKMVHFHLTAGRPAVAVVAAVAVVRSLED